MLFQALFIKAMVLHEMGQVDESLQVFLQCLAVDEDFPPHAAPFTFEMPDDLLVNWTVIRVNGKERASGVRMEQKTECARTLFP